MASATVNLFLRIAPTAVTTLKASRELEIRRMLRYVYEGLLQCILAPEEWSSGGIHSYKLLVVFEILEFIFSWSFEVMKTHDLCP